MTNDTSRNDFSATSIIIAREVPSDVRDCGKVRMGGAIKFCWLTWELLQHLPSLIRFLPGTAC
jgi:hypothetical protein